MIVNDRVVAYINSLSSGNGGLCDEIEAAARARGVPIIRREMASFLKVMLALKKPQNILEVGAAVGFSAILMSGHMPEGCRITTIERSEDMLEQARVNFARAPRGRDITLLEGDATEVLEGLPDDSYDFVFMDAAKGQYINFLPQVTRLMKKDALLISDNVLQEGDIVQSRFATTRRDRTIHERMREYIWTLTHTEGLLTTVVPIGDGITLTVKE
jgi:predicted O-methyltransferase YrrM